VWSFRAGMCGDYCERRHRKSMAEQNCRKRLEEMAIEIRRLWLQQDVLEEEVRQLKREGRFVVRKIGALADAMRETMPNCAADIDLVLSGLAKLVADRTAGGAQ